MGVLIRDAEALELMEKVDTLVVDKTGTLTEGKPRVVGVTAAAGVSESEVLAAAAGLEVSSEHPLAQAILAAAKERDVVPTADQRVRIGHGPRCSRHGARRSLRAWAARAS